MVVLEGSGEEFGGFGVGFPGGEALLEAGEVGEEGDEGFALVPVVGDLGVEPLAAGLGSGLAFGDFADGEEGMAEEGAGEAACVSPEEFFAEGGGGEEADFVRFGAGEEVVVVTEAEASGQFLIGSGALLAATFEVEAFEVESFGRAESAPDGAVDAGGDEVVAGDADGVGDCSFEWGRFLAPGAGAGEFAGDVNVLDGAVAGEDAEGGGVGRKLVIGIAEVGGVSVGIVEVVHGIELALHLVLDLGIDFIEEGDLFAGLFTENEEDCSLDVVASFEGAIGFRGDAPSGGDTKSAGPENESEVRPDGGVLMGEHDDLHAIVRHMRGEVGIAIDHAIAEGFVAADDSKSLL